MTSIDNLDLVNRDPNGINNHLSCQFEEVLAEPDSTHSIDCVWKMSYTCFILWKGLCYKLATLCCGICIAAELGCEFAEISFCHIWCFTPCFKMIDINCGCMKKCWTNIIQCCIEPCCESCGAIFNAFKKH